MDHYDDLKRLLDALAEYNRSGIMPSDKDDLNAISERVLVINPTERLALEWNKVVNDHYDDDDFPKNVDWRR